MVENGLEMFKMHNISKEFVVERRNNIENKITRHVQTLIPKLRKTAVKVSEHSSGLSPVKSETDDRASLDRLETSSENSYRDIQNKLRDELRKRTK